ncbi:sensor histidine kinase [Bosea sp. 2KB_26]|uniref:sensor histidine kinase n=1 Tax=Bosea sp. 2KB_26 TaxID=3237475 RepID=UPI003F9154B8
MEDAGILAQAIVDTIAEPFVVLDDQLRVVKANNAFCTAFHVDRDEMAGRPLASLGDGQWDIAALRVLLDGIIPGHAVLEGFEIEHECPHFGRRIILLNARQLVDEDGAAKKILLTCTDITARRAVEREKEELLKQTEELLRQKDVLLQEIQHRVANSLQIIASILLLKARAVSSEETRRHLKDAHQRVMSVAEVQRHLDTAEGIDQIEVSSYLTKLCASLASSMVGEGQPIAVEVIADAGMIRSDQAVSLGLIVTELVINAIKYAFPVARADAVILITYEIKGADWKLVVSDNGIGKTAGDAGGAGTGLGTAIVQALVKQLDAVMEAPSGAGGMKISITRASFVSRMPSAA